VRPVLVDSSAWVEFLRGTGSRTHQRLRKLLADPASVAITDPVLMEILAGGRTRGETIALRRLLGSCGFLPVEGPADYETAAELYRSMRGRGETIGSLLDCLIAAVAIRTGTSLLHADRDFDVLARAVPLNVA